MTERDTQPQLQWWQTILFILGVLNIDHLQYLLRQTTGPCYAQSRRILIFQNTHDDGIPFHENLGRTIAIQHPANRLKKIETEIGCRIESFCHQARGDMRRATHICLDDDMLTNLLFYRLMFMRCNKVIELAVRIG